MKKLFGAVLITAALVFGVAIAQVNTTSLQAQIQTVAKLVAKAEATINTRANNTIKDYPYLFSQDQVQALLPYLREVRAMSSLTQADVDFYAAKIASILTSGQRKEVSVSILAAAGASTPTVAGGGAGGSTSVGGFTTVAVNPFIDAGDTYGLDHIIVNFTLMESNF